MKVIDLLNLVYERKAPRKILYKYCEYEFDYDINDYRNRDNLELFTYLFTNEEQALYLEVEIIEEEEEIEELCIEKDLNSNNYYLIDKDITKCQMTRHSKIIANKLNEVIKELNMIKKEGE